MSSHQPVLTTTQRLIHQLPLICPVRGVRGNVAPDVGVPHVFATCGAFYNLGLTQGWGDSQLYEG